MFLSEDVSLRDVTCKDSESVLDGRKLAGSSNRARFTIEAYFDVAFPRGNWMKTFAVCRVNVYAPCREDS